MDRRQTLEESKNGRPGMSCKMTLIYSLQGSYTYMGAFLLLHFGLKGHLRTFGGLIVSLQLPEAQLTRSQPDTSPDNQKPYLQVRPPMKFED